MSRATSGSGARPGCSWLGGARSQSLLGIRKESEWECLVIHAAEPTPHTPDSLHVYQSWMNPDHVRPADSEKPPMRRKKYRTR